jgi:enoyl-[acyl-carrier protein] reductase III
MNGPMDPWKTDYRAPSPRYGFEGRIALITGGAHGVGQMLALSLAARGAVPVIVHDSNDDRAQDTVAAIDRQGVSTIAIRARLEDAADIEFVFSQIEEHFGRLDFFILSAERSTFQTVMQLDADDLRRSHDAYVRALVLGAQRSVRLMDRGGRIVVLSSYQSLYGSTTGANLGPVHAAAQEWARQIAVEVAPLGINVNVLMVGIIESDPSNAAFNIGLPAARDTITAQIPKGRPGSAAEVVDCALFLLSPASEYVTGTTVIVDGGLTAGQP